jgi:hypothetical protein
MSWTTGFDQLYKYHAAKQPARKYRNKCAKSQSLCANLQAMPAWLLYTEKHAQTTPRQLNATISKPVEGRSVRALAISRERGSLSSRARRPFPTSRNAARIQVAASTWAASLLALVTFGRHRSLIPQGLRPTIAPLARPVHRKSEESL